MQKNRMFLLITALFLIAISFTACNEPIPDKDLQSAKKAIARAELAKAEKYDPDNLAKAETAYKEALKLVADEENAEARKKAVDAKKTADIATENSKRKMAEEAIAKAEQMLAEAEENRAGFLAQSAMMQAESSLERSRQNLENDKYDQAYTDAESAKESAGKAKDQANQKYQELQRVFGDADKTVQRAGRSSLVNRYAAKEVADARAKLTEARSHKSKVDSPGAIEADTKDQRYSLAAESYQKAYRLAQDARLAAENALKVAQAREKEANKAKATQKMERARRMLEQVRQLKKQGLIKRKVIAPPPAEEDTADDETYDESYDSDEETYSDESEYDDASYDSDEESTESTEESTDTSDQEEELSNQEKYQRALEALQQAEKNFAEDDYQGSIRSADEAIRLAETINKEDKEQQYYTVRLIPSARDCLWRIASYDFIYGDAKLWPKIWKANKEKIVDPDLIYPGQKFLIPPK